MGPHLAGVESGSLLPLHSSEDSSDQKRNKTHGHNFYYLIGLSLFLIKRQYSNIKQPFLFFNLFTDHNIVEGQCTVL